MNSLAQQQLDNLWLAADRLSDAEFFAYTVAAFPHVVDPFVATAGELSATWFEQSQPDSPYISVTAEPIPEARLEGSARWALSAPEVARARLDGVVQRAVYDGARETTMVNVSRSGSHWARDARVDACAFCRMLATRSAVYRTNESAGTRVHDHCHCLPVEDRAGSYVPPDHVARWNDEYLKARADAGSGGTKQILAAWRQQGAH